MTKCHASLISFAASAGVGGCGSGGFGAGTSACTTGLVATHRQRTARL
jgi:hypothetical protein